MLEPLSEDEASEFSGLWARVLEAFEGQGPSLRASIAAGRIISFDNDELVIGFKEADVYHHEQVSKRENRGLVEDFLADTLGKAVRVRFKRIATDDAPAPASAPKYAV